MGDTQPSPTPSSLGCEVGVTVEKRGLRRRRGRASRCLRTSANRDRTSPNHVFSLPNLFLTHLRLPTPLNEYTLCVLLVRAVLPSPAPDRKNKTRPGSLPYPALSADPAGPFHFSLSFLAPAAVVESSSKTLKSSSPKASAIFRSAETVAPSYPRGPASTPPVTPRRRSTVAHRNQK